MPLVRLQGLPCHLHPTYLGWPAGSAAGVSKLRQANDNLGKHGGKLNAHSAQAQKTQRHAVKDMPQEPSCLL